MFDLHPQREVPLKLLKKMQNKVLELESSFFNKKRLEIQKQHLLSMISSLETTLQNSGGQHDRDRENEFA